MTGEPTIIDVADLGHAAEDLVRRAERGEHITITAGGAAVACLVRARDRRWLPWSQIEGLFNGRADIDWAADAIEVEEFSDLRQ